MFVSAYLDAAAVLGGEKGAACRAFALKTLDRMLAKPGATRADSRIAWEARASTDRSTIRFLRGSRCWTPTRRRSTGNISTPPGAPRILPSPNILTPKAAAFSIAPRARRPWAGSKCAASRCRIRPRPAQIPPRPFCSTACTATPETRATATCAEATLEAFAGIAPQFGIHAASYGLAALLHARRPFEVVITGRGGDPQAAALEQAANSVYRFGKAVLRVTPERMASPDRSCARAGRNACRIFAPTSRKRWSAWARRAARPSAIPPRSSRC